MRLTRGVVETLWKHCANVAPQHFAEYYLPGTYAAIVTLTDWATTTAAVAGAERDTADDAAVNRREISG